TSSSPTASFMLSTTSCCQSDNERAARCGAPPSSLENSLRGNSLLKNQARGRAVCQQAPLSIGEAAFCSADSSTTAQHHALGLDKTGLGRDGPQQRDLKFESRRTEALFQERMDCQAHAAVEHCRGETAMHGAGRIEMRAIRHGRDDDTPARGLADVVAQ